jgi:hypothetical protein
MYPAITTTHAIPQTLPSGVIFSEETVVRCRYCLTVLGSVPDAGLRAKVLRKHHCSAMKLAKKPAASVPYN